MMCSSHKLMRTRGKQAPPYFKRTNFPLTKELTKPESRWRIEKAQESTDPEQQLVLQNGHSVYGKSGPKVGKPIMKKAVHACWTD